MSARAGKKEPKEPDLPRFFSVRGRRGVLDSDLAKLNEAVKRNQSRFPEDFRSQLTSGEFDTLMSQDARSGTEGSRNPRSQSAISKADGRGKPGKYRAWVFTEHGALMAANLLRSGRAGEMSIYLVRAFVQMRETMPANAAILKRLAGIDRRLVEHDPVLRETIERLQPLLDPPEEPDAKPKIGYHQGNR